MEKWEIGIRAFRKTAEKYPQESYAMVYRVVQLEWIFLQRVTKDTGQAFTGMEKVLQDFFSLVCSLENRPTPVQLWKL